MSSNAAAHEQKILDQFTRQAAPFAQAPSHSTEESLRVLLETAEVKPEDDALDVACGPGIVACSLAEVARSAVGVDMVPAMLEQARQLQAKKHLANVLWEQGDAARLALEDERFSLVTTRYSFHHMLNPVAALREMTRVCRQGGRVVVADATPEAGKSAAYDALEQSRDASHTHALSLTELLEMGEEVGLRFHKQGFYRLDVSVEDLLSNSFPADGDGEQFRSAVRADIGIDRLSIRPYERDGMLGFSFPISVVSWRKA